MFNFNIPGNTYSRILDWYHNYTNSILFAVLVLVFIFIYFLLFTNRFFKINGIIYQFREILCVVIPTFLICGLVYYRIFILYITSMLDVWRLLTLKVVGSQWYWHYEFSDINSGFDRIITPLEELGPQFLHRNFDTTPILILPQGVSVRGCLTATDVIHSWSLPSLGVKMDCNPGILSVITFKIPLIGIFWGGCAEICGVGHRIIPINLEVASPNLFLSFINLLFIINYYMNFWSSRLIWYIFTHRFYCTNSFVPSIYSPSLKKLFGQDFLLSEQDLVYLNLIREGRYILTSQLTQAVLCSFCYFFLMVKDESLTSGECEDALRYFTTLKFYGILGRYNKETNSVFTSLSNLFFLVFKEKGYYKILPSLGEDILTDDLISCYSFPFVVRERRLPFFFNSKSDFIIPVTQYYPKGKVTINPKGLINIDHCRVPFCRKFLRQLLIATQFTVFHRRSETKMFLVVYNIINRDYIDSLYKKCQSRPNEWISEHHEFYFLILLKQSSYYLSKYEGFRKRQFLDGIIFDPFLF